MIKNIIDKINAGKQIEARQLLRELKISPVLLEYMLKGMEKKEYIKSIKCSECEYQEVCTKNRNFCKGYGKYWILTDKTYEGSDKN